MTSNELFSREEVLGGLPARRARSLLFQIEVATAQAGRKMRRLSALIDQPALRPVASLVQGQSAEESFGEGEDAWLRAFGRGRTAGRPPSIRQIERYARAWAYLAPTTPRLQAAVARLMGRKYRFTHAAVPGMREALRLDTEEVQQIYQAMYGEALESLYAPSLSLTERLNWFLAAVGKRLDALPPFWMAFAYTLMGNFPGAILALPIAVAGIGPLAGLTLLCVIGGINLLTIACMAQGVAGSGFIQYRNMYLGRLTASYLGVTGSRLVYSTSLLQAFLVLLAGYVAFSFALAHAVGLPPMFWIGVFTAILIYRLWRGERNSGVIADFVLGIGCIGLALTLSCVALMHLRPALIGHVHAALLSRGNLNRALLAGVFGGLLVCYPAHAVVPQCAKIALPRDGSGRSLIRGCVAGTLCAIVLHSLWLLAIMGAVSADALAKEPETALRPLGEILGPFVAVLGAITVCLFIGLDGTGASDILFALIRERLPAIAHSVGVLSRHQDRLLFHRHDDFADTPRLGLVYLGLEHGHPRFRVDVLSGYNVHRLEIVLEERWEVEALYDRFPELRRHGYHLGLELLEADESTARFLIATPLKTAYEGGRETAGLNMIVALDISEDERQLLRWLMAQGEASVQEAAAAHHLSEAIVAERLSTLEKQRMIQRAGGEGPVRYRPKWTKRRRSRLPEGIWRSLEGSGGEAETPAPARRKHRAQIALERAREAALSETGRFLLSAAPIALAGLVSLWLLFINQASYTGILEVAGILTVILSSGFFPVLLLASCRRKGMAAPAGFWRFLGSPVLLGALYLFFMALLVAQGSLFGRHLWERALTLLVAFLVLGSTLVMIRRGAFRSRQVVELREDLRDDTASAFRIVANGRPAPAQVRMEYVDGVKSLETAAAEVPTFATLRRIEFDLPATAVEELKVWTHRVTPAGDSETLPTLLEIRFGKEIRHFDLGLQGGQVVLPRMKGPCQVAVILEPSAQRG